MNEIKAIATDQLKRMEKHEGMVFEGCGDPEGWVEGINRDLTAAGILLNGTHLHNVYSFKRDGMTCLLFDFEGAELDIGKLAIWRLQTHGSLGGTWLSDYVPNHLGGFMRKQDLKLDCELIGQDGNIFNLMGIASRTLRMNGMKEEADEMVQRITGGDCASYDDALCIIGDYVNITGPDDQEYSIELGGM